MAFEWSDLIAPLIQTGGSLVSGMLGQSAQEDAQKQARADELRNQLYGLEVAKIKAGYSGSGGGGSRGGGGGDNISKLIGALNNQIGVSQAGAERTGSAYNSLSNLIQRGYLGG